MYLNFRNLFFVNTNLTYSNASNSHILQYQEPLLQVCGVHSIRLIMTWFFPHRAIKRKSQKRIER